MTKTVKKILSVFIVLSLINGMFVFADEKFIPEMKIVEIKKIESGEEIKGFSIGDFLKTEGEKISFDYNKKLQIKLSENTEFNFSDFDDGEILNGQVSISSLSKYVLKVGDLKINLKNSGIILEKKDLKINILSKYGVNFISYKGEKFFITEGDKISFDLENFETGKDIFSKIEKISLSKKEISENEKIFPEDEKILLNSFGKNQNFLSSLIVFDSKKMKNENFEKVEKFNDCVNSIFELTENEKNENQNISRFYSQVEKKCINEDILKNEYFLEKFNKNFEEISVLKQKFLIEEMKKKFLGEKFSFLEKIFYLQQNISSSDIKNFSFFLEQAEKSFQEENNLENLEIGFILIDGILKNDLQFSFEKLYDFRKKIAFKVLEKFYEGESEDLNYYTEKLIGFNFDFTEILLNSKKYKELDYVFANKFIYQNPKNTNSLREILENYDKKFEDYRKILDSSKNILHGSAEKEDEKNLEEIKKIEEEKKQKEAEIKKMLDSFKPQIIEEVEITSEENREKIVKIFKEIGLKVDAKNVEGFMEGGSLFYVNEIEFADKKYDLVFDISRNIVSKIKGEKFDGEGSMTLYSFKNLLSNDNYKVASFDEKPMNVFQDIEEKDFSQEAFLKKELVRKYLETTGIFTDAKDIIKINEENFFVKNAKIEKYKDLNIEFQIKLLDWNISKIALFEKKDSAKLKLDFSIEFAKSLKNGIEKVYGDYLLRNENMIKVFSDLAQLGIKKDDVFIGEKSVDGFKIYKGFEMTSGNAILSGDYYVGEKVFTKVRFTLGEHFEDFENISVGNLAERIKFINKNINDLEKIKTQEELERIKEQQRLEQMRKMNYGDEVPDELLDGAWITD